MGSLSLVNKTVLADKKLLSSLILGNLRCISLKNQSTERERTRTVSAYYNQPAIEKAAKKV